MHERERGGTQSDYWRMREVVEGGGREVVEVGEWKWWREVGKEVQEHSPGTIVCKSSKEESGQG